MMGYHQTTQTNHNSTLCIDTSSVYNTTAMVACSNCENSHRSRSRTSMKNMYIQQQLSDSPRATPRVTAQPSPEPINQRYRTCVIVRRGFALLVLFIVYIGRRENLSTKLHTSLLEISSVISYNDRGGITQVRKFKLNNYNSTKVLMERESHRVRYPQSQQQNLYSVNFIARKAYLTYFSAHVSTVHACFQAWL